MDASQQRPRVSILFPNQYDEAAGVLGRAFVDDPLIKAIIPPGVSAEERVRRMSGFFASSSVGIVTTDSRWSA